LRRELIEQRGAETTLDVKIHLDGMKRVVTRRQRYFSQKVEDTPFSLGIALPDGYGKYKVFGQIELSRAIQDPRSNRAMDHFSTGNWSLHPEWVYCEYKYDDGQHDFSPEELMTDFLSRAQKPHWKWRSTRTRPPEHSMSHTTSSCFKPEGTFNQKSLGKILWRGISLRYYRCIYQTIIALSEFIRKDFSIPLLLY
ncbi:Voltage-dependent calcium channel subunit alpha-2/delta-4, partial [Halocaridina rubra]